MANHQSGVGKCLGALGMAGILGAVSLVGCAQFGGGNEEAQVQDLTISVEAANPVTGNLVLQNEFMGSISPEETVYVFPKAQGEVTSTNFEVGDIVQEGDVLFTIDDEVAQLQLASAQVGAASAKAQASAAQIGIENAELTERSTIDQLNNAKVLQMVGE